MGEASVLDEPRLRDSAQAALKKHSAKNVHAAHRFDAQSVRGSSITYQSNLITVLGKHPGLNMVWGRVGRHRPLVKPGGRPMRRDLQISLARPGARVAAHRMGPWHAMLTLAMAMIEQVHMLVGSRSFWLAINILSKCHRHGFCGKNHRWLGTF